MVDLPGGEGANEGFWRFQIRDKYGKWVEMGGSVTFDTMHPNFGRLKGNGTFTGGSRPGFALIKVKDVDGIKDGSYEVPSADFEAVKAIIPKNAPGLIEAKRLDAADGTVVNNIVNTPATKDLTGFKRLSEKKGSNEGGLFEDPATGEKFYVKFEEPARADNEVLASKLYAKMNLNAIKVEKGMMDGRTITYSAWTEDTTADLPKRLSDDRNIGGGRLSREMEKGFAVDAWLGNWDVVGTDFSNIVFDKDGNFLRVDPGGALLYRARGERKGDAFTNTVNELKSFKEPGTSTNLVYGGANNNSQIDSAKRLLNISNNDIDSLVDETISDPKDNALLKERLKGRREYILDQYGLRGYDSDKQYTQEDGNPITMLQGSDTVAVENLMGPGKEAGPKITLDATDTSGYLDRYDDPDAPLADVIEGDDIKQLILRDGYKKLLSDKTSDKGYVPVGEALSDQHKIVYETLVSEDPKIKERFPTFDEYFRYTYTKLAIDDMFLIGQNPDARKEDRQTSWEGKYSAEDLALMKNINRTYAKKILKLNPDGRIKIYRNAYALSFNYGQEKTALPGYWSFDREFAYSFNGAQEGNRAFSMPYTGRYTGSIAVDDVTGIIGMMRSRDEPIAGRNLDLLNEMPLSLSPVEINNGILKDVEYKGHVRDLAKPNGGKAVVVATGGSGDTTFRHRGELTSHYIQPVPFKKEDLDKAAADTNTDISNLDIEQLSDGRYQVVANSVGSITTLSKLQTKLNLPLIVNNFTRTPEGRAKENSDVWATTTNEVTIVSPEKIEGYTTVPEVSFSDDLLAELSDSERASVQISIDRAKEHLFYELTANGPLGGSEFKAPKESIDYKAKYSAGMVDFQREELKKLHDLAVARREAREENTKAQEGRKVEAARGILKNSQDQLAEFKKKFEESPSDEMAKMNVEWAESSVKEKETIVSELESGYDRAENPGHSPISERLQLALGSLEGGGYDPDGSLRALLLSGASEEEFMSAYKNSSKWKENAAPKVPDVEIGSGGLLPPPGSGFGSDFVFDPNNLSDFTIGNVFKKDTRLSDEENAKAFKDATSSIENPPLQIAQEITSIKDTTPETAGTYDGIQIGSLVEHGDNPFLYGKISEKSVDPATGDIILTIEWSDGTVTTSTAAPDKPLKIWDKGY